MDELKLLPCPICGGKARAWQWNGGARVECENWDMKDESFHMVGVGARTMDEAVAAWTRRYDPDVDDGR